MDLSVFFVSIKYLQRTKQIKLTTRKVLKIFQGAYCIYSINAATYTDKYDTQVQPRRDSVPSINCIFVAFENKSIGIIGKHTV